MTGDVKRLPYPDHCRILEGMFRGWTAEQLLQVADTIDAGGGSVVTYRHELLNLPPTPLRRLSRQLWFKHTSGALAISATPLDDHKVMIQRTHDAPSMSKFACQFSPAIEPGDTARFEYGCTGGPFLDELYWRPAIPR